MESDPISRAALGNIATIGDMYDARTDKFSGVSIFKQTVPPEAITITDTNFSDIQLIFSDDMSDKFEKMDVHAELQVSLLSGLIKLGGSGHYLKDQKKSARTAKCSFLYSIKTKDEIVNLYHQNLKKIFSVEAIEADMSTHVVVGISYGANSVLSCEYSNKEETDMQKIEGSLSAELEKIKLKITGKAGVDYGQGDIQKSSNFHFRVYGDIVPKDGLPSDITAALDFMKHMPQLVSNTGKGLGKPLTYKLLPITAIENVLKFKSSRLLRTLDEATSLRVVGLFEDVSKAQQQFHDFYEDVVKYRYCVEDEDFGKVTSLKEDLVIHESKLRKQLATNLVEIRSGKAESSNVNNMIIEFQTSVSSPQNVALSLKTWGALIRKVKFARRVSESGATYIGHGMDLDDEFLKNDDVKTLVLYYSSASFSDSDVWFKNRQIFFQELKTKTAEDKAYVVDLDIHKHFGPEGNSSCIQIVRNGRIVIKDLLTELEQESSIPFAQAISGTEKIISKPDKRVALMIPCIGTNCLSDEVYDWICKQCRSGLEWGFDENVYCNCGKTPATKLEFKCLNERHGILFEAPKPEEFKKLLAMIKF